MRISYPGSRGTVKPVILASIIFVLVFGFECRRVAKEKFMRTEVGEKVSLQLMEEEKSRKFSAEKIAKFLFCFWCDTPQWARASEDRYSTFFQTLKLAYQAACICNLQDHNIDQQ
jgi:hypothetical protein